VFENVIRKFAAVNTLAEKIGDQKIIELAKFLRDRIDQPDNFIAMLGETSSGKTTLLNGFLGGNYLYTSVKPSTAAIVELECTPEDVSQQYYAILRNATAAKLSREDFIEHSKSPNDSIKRLWMRNGSPKYANGKIRLFDTPGYGSVIEKHEEVLSEFLPESNMIIYVVSYKVGIQQDDYNFISYVSEIIAKDTEFVLVVNRTPGQVGSDDRRISEIQRYVSDLLHYTPKTFLVPDIYCENNDYPLPKCEDLWAYVKEKIFSEENQRHLEKCLEGYVFGLFERCNAHITQKMLAQKLNDDDKNKLIEELEKAIVGIELAKNELVKPTFAQLASAIPPKLTRAKNHVIQAIHEKISDSDKMRKDEIVAYINLHMLQFETKKQVDEIKAYIESKLTRLNKQIEDMLNQCIQKIEHTIELHFSVEVVHMTKGLLKKFGGNVLEQSILAYFRKFAGAGGTGIANGAKHLLKKFGNIFGKTFSSGTHNKLASTLSKIGATSAKAVGVAVAVVLEVLFMVIDALTWQPSLKRKVTKGVEKWHDEVAKAMQVEIRNLEVENLKSLDEHIEGFREIIFETGRDDSDREKMDELVISLNATKAVIGEYTYE